MVPKEIFRIIQGLQFRTRRLAEGLFAGRQKSVFRGRGKDFREFRPYTPEDDSRSIDWNVSARFGRPFVRLFGEEREITVLLLMDGSASLNFGTRVCTKRELLAEIAGGLAFIAARTNDRIGAVFFTSAPERYLPPRKGYPHIWQLLTELHSWAPAQRSASIPKALEFVHHKLRQRSILFILSDFLDEHLEKPLKLAARKHDLRLVQLIDPADRELPPVGLLRVQDPESGRQSWIDTMDPAVRKHHMQQFDRRASQLRAAAASVGAKVIPAFTDRPAASTILELLNVEKRRR